MASIRIGTCGYSRYDPGEDWQDEYENTLAAYAGMFPAVELNRTFYELPQVSTAARWRREAGEGFVFAVKAWQGVTHPWRSPTWNGYRDGVDDAVSGDLGLLQPTAAVREAWQATREIARALEAEVVLVQTPPSFDCTDDHAADMRELLSSVDRGDVTVAWEPRGDWPDAPDRIAALCDELDLVHVVDVMRAEPVDDGEDMYTRLHGLNDDPYDYAYDYSAADLDALAETLRAHGDHRERVYSMFNNYEMYSNAQALLDRLDGG